MNKLSTLLIEDHGPVRIVTINRPQVLNALSGEVVAELSEVAHAARRDAAHATLRGIVLTGAGSKAFVAGADIAAMASMGEAEAREFARQGHALGELLAGLPIPVIAAVNGLALGGGAALIDLNLFEIGYRSGSPDQALRVKTRLNGETVQDSHTGHMIFSIPRLIAYSSGSAPARQRRLLFTANKTAHSEVPINWPA